VVMRVKRLPAVAYSTHSSTLAKVINSHKEVV
jgi:hypothetical protein